LITPRGKEYHIENGTIIYVILEVRNVFNPLTSIIIGIGLLTNRFH